MIKTTDLHKSAMDMLLETSRTFFIPISHLSPGLQESVASAYLCMRAIDEIEDHPGLPSDVKINLLRSVSLLLEKPIDDNELMALFQPHNSLLPEVTLRLGDWVKLSPPSIAPNIQKATAIMANGMADWVSKEWRIKNEKDLDDYTFYVAGLVGILLSEIWKWHDDIETDRDLAVAFGRGLQAVNIIRNRAEDLSRGVDFFPDEWKAEDMFSYARRNLALADAYLKSIKSGTILIFCRIPLILAHGTLDALAAGKEKLDRATVTHLVRQVTEA
ncbi:phytoene/squalene synthase family protein [Aneurinibacillus aneurinilyticus]|jgi:farnesyl-diphosphate farnesyltransferase|uniref:phytoene/squalene synthase family protein n=1 Tax=Aneurinibacillus aneurinilyticus TaxID=1391 RepID=UPI0023EFAD46|nr:phytoene/squalene synthase family protein [Aneurinibacillus aneurinilyticus]MCI1694006.1 phytoene/squalene synthase family protein [Aneurinibacillus aneurinilyticus]